jgi:hypothetical protein
MTATADSTPADIFETVATVEPGDPVELEDEQYDWAGSLDVVDASEPVEWDVPLGDDWWTRQLTIEGARGGCYVIVAINDGRSPTITSYREDDGELDRRGDVLDLVLATVDDPDTSETGDEDLEESEGDHECPDCGDQFEAGQHLAGHRNNPHTACSPASADAGDDHEVGEELPEDLEDDGDEEDTIETTEDDTPLPDDVTEADVERAVNSHTYLNEVADALDISPGRTRTLLVHLDYYADVSEGESR